MVLHLALVLSVPICLYAAWWQVQRALGGNTLSFVYVFEWPAFAGVATWTWWVMLTGAHQERRDSTRGRIGDGPVGAGPGLLAQRSRPLRWSSETETGSLRAYNAYLADINSQPLRRGRLPRRPKEARHG